MSQNSYLDTPKPYEPRHLADCFSISDLKSLTKKKLPPIIFDYIERGAEDECTYRRNANIFQTYQFKPRILQDVSHIDLSTRIQNRPSQLPIIIAPTGLTQLFHYTGEKGLAEAAHAKGLIYSLSTVATTSIESIAQQNNGQHYFQLYIWKNRAIAKDLIHRAKQANFQGLFLTVDTAVLGNRERDLQNGQRKPLKRIKNILLGSLSPHKIHWLVNFLRHPKPIFANLAAFVPHHGKIDKVITHINEQFDASVTWADAQEWRSAWGGPFILKGIQSVDDALHAASLGVSGIVLSNHGGRQLDGGPTGLELLPLVKNAFDKNGYTTEIYIDGGIRRGSDIIKAIALGATAVLIGRPMLYGLACGGASGVIHAINILESEMRRTLALIGCASIAELNPDFVTKIHPLDID